jgi:hypothetical protein
MTWSFPLEGMFRATGGVVASYKGATTYGHFDMVSMEDNMKYSVAVNGTSKTFTHETGKLPGLKEKEAIAIGNTNYTVLKIWLEEDGLQTKLHLQELKP